MYFVYNYMTTTPDGISFSDLQDLIKDAPKEGESNKSESFDRAFIEKVADEALSQASEQCKGPMVHKTMVAMIVSNMIDWHTHVGEQMFKEGETEAGTAWLRDAG